MPPFFRNFAMRKPPATARAPRRKKMKMKESTCRFKEVRTASTPSPRTVLKWPAGLLALPFLLLGCGRSTPPKPTPRPHLTTEVMLKTTPVKDQGRSELCWVYAMLATIETEHLTQGDSVNLSPDYIARLYLTQQARSHYLGHGRTAITLRGTAPMLLRLVQTYGLVPYDSYPEREPRANCNVLCRQLEQASRHAPDLHRLQRRADDLLDQGLGVMPAARVYMLGASYTPLEFAHSVCRADEYEALTSFTHHPFGRRFALEVPDNRMGDLCLNLPLDTLVSRVDRSLRHGHPVCWEGDISNDGFSFARGTARVDPRLHVGQALRQRLFERRQTTDDHCMALVGIVRTRKGRKLYVAKNSWGTGNAFGGFVYMNENYLRQNTICVVMKRSY